ncbi:MAG: quinone-dependent dihydroorotate dehydrogenase [Betaproteobacteria bacterium]|nr:quinone-dependent dihydroorotate dehydrogenase [Betaproteobacteria bacterium]
MSFYASVIRPLAFRLDAERAHHLAIGLGASMRALARPLYRLNAIKDPRLDTVVAGLRFPTPLGLAAGFDKSGTAIEMLAALGFGFVEIGSVSIDPSFGNARPRLFRLPDDRAIVVHYGLPNDGARTIAERLAKIHLPVPLGINLVKTNRGLGAAPESGDQIINEYVAAARVLAPVADYLMLNLSCPNTEDGRDFFADAGHLRAFLTAFGELQPSVPVFLKVSPLGGIATIERVLTAVEDHAYISGFMFNLPPVKPDGLKTPERIWRALPGAVSGPPAAALADTCIRETFRRMDRKRYAIVGAGGVGTAEDAYAKMRLGATLVQLLTALVYEGPGVVRRITQGLVRLVERDGLRHISDVVGVDA